jgi:hypothetical protein
MKPATSTAARPPSAESRESKSGVLGFSR